MIFLRFSFAVIAFFVSGCATAIDNPRSLLVDEKMPFGLSWSLTSEEKANFDAEHAAECLEIFEGMERESAIQNCLQESRVSSRKELPPPLENGFLEIFHTPNGNVIAHTHIRTLFCVFS